MTLINLRVLFPLILLVLLVAPACSGKDTHPGGEEGEEGHEEGETREADRTTAAALLDDVQGDDYRSFPRAPGWEKPRQPGQIAHHGAFLDVYLNDVLAAAVDQGADAPWPVGSIVIKDGWSDAGGKELYQIAILKKLAEGKWFGAEYSASGEVREAGTNFEECQGCHAKGRDYILGF